MVHFMCCTMLVMCFLILSSSGCSQKEIREQVLMDLQKEIIILHKYNTSTNRRIDELGKITSGIEYRVNESNQAIRELQEIRLGKSIPDTLEGTVKEGAEQSGDAAGQPNVVRGKLEEATTTLETDTLVDPQELYRKAFDEFSSGDYDQAIKDFRRFVKGFPAHNYADNALYWLGETYYSQKNFPRAIIEFKKVPEEYPNGNKVPDAMLKIGLSYANLRDFKNAEDYLQMVLEMYPFSNAARKADLGLKEMKK